MNCRFDRLIGDDSSYRRVEGTVFLNDEPMRLEIYDNGRSDQLAMKVFRGGGNITGTIANQPRLYSTGSDSMLAMGSSTPGLPTSDRGIEAFARYIHQAGTEDLSYRGPNQVLKE